MKTFSAIVALSLLVALASKAQAQTGGEVRKEELANLRAEIVGAYAMANAPGCRAFGQQAIPLIGQAVIYRFQAAEFSPATFEQRIAKGLALIAQANALSRQCPMPDVARRGALAKRQALITERAR